MNVDAIVATLRRRDKEEQARIVARIEAAKQAITALLARFQEIDPNLKKVILFGSLAKNNVRSEHFDIDLAVDCSWEKYLALVSAALDADFKVDLVELAKAPPAWRKRIEEEGVVLYEKR